MMHFNLTQLVHWVMFVVATFYRENLAGFNFPHIQMPHFNKPEMEIPKLVEVKQETKEQALEIGEMVAELTGHESTEEILKISLEYTKKHDNLKAATSLIEDLLSDGLSAQQIKEVEKWDKKIDAAISLSVFLPEVKQQLNDQIMMFTDGNLDVEQLDTIVHAVLGKNKQ